MVLVNRKLIAAISVGLVLTIALFTVTRINGSQVSSGTTANLMYDSGWLNITDKQGQYVTITDGLNISNWNDPNLIVEITGKTDLNGGILRYLGLSTASVGWSKTYGESSYDEGHYGLVQTSDGGYAMAGETWSFGNGDADFYLVRADVNGTLLWQKAYGGPNDDKCYSMIQTTDGGFALAGYTDSFGAGGQDFWLVKTDSAGNMQWNQTYGGIGDECALSVIQTSDGGYALAGYTTSYGVGGLDFWLVKTDSAGNMQWNMTYGGISDDYARCVIQTSDGGYALAGYTYSFGAGGSDAWLVKTDASGNVQWNKTYGGPGDEQFMSFIQRADGGYVLAGSTTSFGAGGADFWLVSVDSQSNELWNKTYGGSGTDVPWHMIQTSDGGYALAGFTYSYGAGDADYWLVKTDSSGNEQWNRTYGGPEYDEARFLIQTSDGGYALSGRTYSFGAGLSDVWLVKVDSSGILSGETGLVWTNSSSDSITVYRGASDPYWNFMRVQIFTDPPAHVKLLGDINGDGRVSLADLIILANAYGSRPGDTRWNANADLDGNGVVSLSDLIILATHYGNNS